MIEKYGFRGQSPFSYADLDGGAEAPPFRFGVLRAREESRSLSASRARQNAAGKKKRGAPFGMTRVWRFGSVKSYEPAGRRRYEVAARDHLLSRMPRPRLLIVKCRAGGTTSVVYSPSTMAGPSITFPGRSDSYVKIGVGRKSFSGGQ